MQLLQRRPITDFLIFAFCIHDVSLVKDNAHYQEIRNAFPWLSDAPLHSLTFSLFYRRHCKCEVRNDVELPIPHHMICFFLPFASSWPFIHQMHRSRPIHYGNLALHVTSSGLRQVGVILTDTWLALCPNRNTLVEWHASHTEPFFRPCVFTDSLFTTTSSHSSILTALSPHITFMRSTSRHMERSAKLFTFQKPIRQFFLLIGPSISVNRLTPHFCFLLSLCFYKCWVCNDVKPLPSYLPQPVLFFTHSPFGLSHVTHVTCLRLKFIRQTRYGASPYSAPCTD